MVKVPTGLNNFFKKVNDLDVGKLKTVPKDLKKLSDVVDKEVVKKTVYNTLNTKVNNLEKKIPDGSTLNQTNQYNTSKQNLKKIVGDIKKKVRDITGLATTPVLNTNISGVKNKIPDATELVR